LLSYSALNCQVKQNVSRTAPNDFDAK
jgi:hypothetical protein